MSITINKQNIASIGDYWQLLKPRIMYLVVFTGITGVIAAPGTIHPFIAVVSILCIALGSGAGGALNMWYDSDIDAIMSRTKARPIPSGRMPREYALEYGLVLSVLSVTLMAIAVNYTAALLLAVGIAYYVVVYTILLKRRTPQNIVIGGAAGAFPPMIGWASVTEAVSLESLLLFAIIFVWTPPHFWALSLPYCDDYRKANVPMMPIYSISKTKTSILCYSVLLVFLSLLLGLFVKRPVPYEVCAACLGGVFLAQALAVFRTNSLKACKSLFSYSICYLFLLFTAVAVCSL